MRSLRRVLPAAVVLAVACAAVPARAISPQNPYRTFNLSGINYGSMQWERAQREGRRVWPYYNTPSRSVTTSSGPGSSGIRGGGVWVGGVVGGGAGAGAIVEAGGSRSAPRSSPRAFRRWRR